jgi:hypothetical protein
MNKRHWHDHHKSLLEQNLLNLSKNYSIFSLLQQIVSRTNGNSLAKNSPGNTMMFSYAYNFLQNYMQFPIFDPSNLSNFSMIVPYNAPEAVVCWQ